MMLAGHSGGCRPPVSIEMGQAIRLNGHSPDPATFEANSVCLIGLSNGKSSSPQAKGYQSSSRPHRAISDRMSAKVCRETATSAMWNVT